MNYLKRKITARFVVFLTVIMIVFWSVPCNFAFGEVQEGSELPDTPESEQSEAIDITTEVTAETTEDTATEEITEAINDTTAETETEETATDTTDTEATLLPDTTPPVITIIGESPLMVELGFAYVDAGATAADDVDGDLTGFIEVLNTVDTTVPGSYKVTYNVSDAAGNAAAEVTRIVNVAGKPTVATDKDDYSPGEIVVVTGSGWLPGETVKLDFAILPLQLTLTYYATADSEGSIYNNEYMIFEHHLGQTIVLTATGQTTGLSAVTIFTDSPQLGSVTVGTQSPNPVYPATSARYTITITRGAGTGAFTANLSMTTALPSGCTASFSPSAVSFLATDNTKTSTLTITTTSGSTPIGISSFTVKAEVFGTPADFATGSGTLRVGGVGLVTMGAQSPNPIYASDSATYTITINRSGGTGAFSVDLSIIYPLPLPSGCTYSFSPSTVSFSSGDVSKTSTLTVSTSSSSPAVNTYLVVRAVNPDNSYDYKYGIGRLVIVRDTTVPTVTLTAYSPDPTIDNTPSYSGSAADTYTNIVDIEYCVDSGTWTDVDAFTPAKNVSFTFTTSTLSDGTHTIYARAYDAAGNLSAVASDTLTVGTPPAITGQPSSATKIIGESVTFTVTASGTAPLSYQWRKDGANISGATSSSYTIPSVVLSDAGSYDVVVSNAYGSATSNTATLTVNSPQIGLVTVGTQSPIAVYPPASARYTITITRGAGTGAFTANLSILTALPSGCTASFSPSAVSFLATDNTKTSTLTITTTSGSTPIGISSFTVKAEVFGTPADFKTGNGTLTVGGVGSLTMGTQSPNPVYASSSATYAITINRSGGTGPFSVNLSVIYPLLSGCTYSFSPSTVSFSSGDASKTSTLTVSTSASTPAVNTYLVIRAVNVSNPNDYKMYGVGLVIVRDTTVPTVTLTAYSPDPTTDNTPSYSGSAADTYTNVVDIEYCVDSGTWTNVDLFTPAKNISFTFTTSALTDGEHTIYVRAYDAAGNVSVVVSDTLTVGTPPTITGQPLSATKIIGESVTFSVTASGTAPLNYQWRKDGINISGATSSSYTIPSVVLGDAGSYDVVVSNAYGSVTSNTATLTVNPITTTLSVTPVSGTYGGTVELSATISPQVAGKTISFTLNGASAGSATTDASGVATLSGVSLSGIDAGLYPTGVGASFAGDSNYIASSDSDSLTVNPAPLTITADNASKVYGDPNPAFSVTYSGFAAGDDESDLLGTLGITTPATEASPVGTYPITPSGLSSTNYSITFVDGTLTINPAPLTVTADNASRLYGNPNPLFNGTITGIVNSDNITATYDSPALITSPVGTYPVIPVLSDPDSRLGNYTVVVINGTLTITPAPLTVTAGDASKVYGSPNPAFSVTYSGFKAGDNKSDLNGSLRIKTTAEDTSPVGTYPITPSRLSSDNYNITFVDGTLTVTAAATIVTTTGNTDGKLEESIVAVSGETSDIDVKGNSAEESGGSTVTINYGTLDKTTALTTDDGEEPNITVAGITSVADMYVPALIRLSPVILILGFYTVGAILIMLCVFVSRMRFRKFNNILAQEDTIEN